MKYALNTGKQSGVMLLEALIGILIFSIGVLAIVGLQANTMNVVKADNRARTTTKTPIVRTIQGAGVDPAAANSAWPT